MDPRARIGGRLVSTPTCGVAWALVAHCREQTSSSQAAIVTLNGSADASIQASVEASTDAGTDAGTDAADGDAASIAPEAGGDAANGEAGSTTCYAGAAYSPAGDPCHVGAISCGSGIAT
jgi:hypothetical protein